MWLVVIYYTDNIIKNLIIPVLPFHVLGSESGYQLINLPFTSPILAQVLWQKSIYMTVKRLCAIIVSLKVLKIVLVESDAYDNTKFNLLLA